jgi:hypothetical protein
MNGFSEVSTAHDILFMISSSWKQLLQYIQMCSSRFHSLWYNAFLGWHEETEATVDTDGRQHISISVYELWYRLGAYCRHALKIAMENVTGEISVIVSRGKHATCDPAEHKLCRRAQTCAVSWRRNSHDVWQSKKLACRVSDVYMLCNCRVPAVYMPCTSHHESCEWKQHKRTQKWHI